MFKLLHKSVSSTSSIAILTRRGAGRTFLTSSPASFLSRNGQFAPQHPTHEPDPACTIGYIPTVTVRGPREREGDPPVLTAQQMVSQAESKRASLLDCMEWYDAMEYDSLRPTTLLDRDGKTICEAPEEENELNREYAFVKMEVFPGDA